MTFFYNIGIRIYYFLVLIASPFNSKAKLWIKGRRKVWDKLISELDSSKEYVWFHASSLGEFEQGRPLIESLKERQKGLKIILTFFSPSGYEIRKNYSGADIICYLPLDTPGNARKFVQLIKPKWTFFIKYEYWYNFLKYAKYSGSKLFLISGIFRENQLFFKSYGKWYKKNLRRFDHLFVQNESSGKLLQNADIKNYTVAGDSRFDRVVQIASQSKTIEIAEKFAEGSHVIVCGSTWEPDEVNLLKYLHDSNIKNLKLIIAPHEIHKAHIHQITEKIELPYSLFSEADSLKLKDSRILIIDNIGMLSSIYKYGQISYIGGGFGAGIHNTLEAAVYGVPVIFGPNYKKFQEAIGLIDCNAAFSYSSYTELSNLLDNMLQGSDLIKKSGVAAKNYVDSMKGATSIIEEHLFI
jgi:3-deoxy-D-manno-octulosonic-acid transferase